MNSTIGKCCYCGQKVFLEHGQALSCASCGAPLRQFQAAHSIKVKPKPKVEKQKFTPIKTRAKCSSKKKVEQKSKKPSRRFKWSLEKIVDTAEDIWDIFD